MRLPLVCRLVVVSSVLGQTLASFADDSRLAVVGTARIEQRPDVMEVVANVAASGTMSGDALKKFRANRRRGIEAITKLKIKGLEVKGAGMSVVSSAIVQQMRNRFGNGQQGGDGDSTFNETVTFVIPGIDHLTDEQVQDLAAKILDAAKDAGLVLGFPNDQNPYVYNYNSYRPQVVHFRVSDIEAIRQRAMDLAAKDARTRAEQMASRLKLNLGKPVQVRDATRSVVVNRQVVNTVDASVPETSATLHNVAIEATLSVEYEILK
jgi:uncharacterized protein YggE